MAKLLIPKEIAKGERRVAAVPETIKKYVKAGIECVVEAGAGEWANVEDDAYRAAGASIAGDAAKAWSEADIVMKVAPPTVEQAGRLKQGSLLVGFMAPHRNLDLVRTLRDRGISCVAMELIPRTTKAQTMDALSSQASIAGYKAVLSEASPIWLRSVSAEGQWNLYTEGWINTVISRDDGTNFGFYDTDFGGCCGNGSNYMTADVIGQEYYDIATKLWNNDFNNLEERGELFKKALDLSAQLAYHVWVIDTQAFIAQRSELSVASDLAAGVSASPLYPFTLRLGDTEGGTVRMAPQDNFIDPWNPVAGSNWVSDGMIQNATMSATR